MAGVVVFGGTSEGRWLAEAFRDTKLDLYVCVATEYGASLLGQGKNEPEAAPPEAGAEREEENSRFRPGGNIHVHAGRMNREEMEEYLRSLPVELCLDATHPFAVEVTENIAAACAARKLEYVRVVRKEDSLMNSGSGCGGTKSAVICVSSVEEAVHFLQKTEGNVLITTGSKELEAFTRIEGYRERCFARVLPLAEVMEKCRSLGFEGKNLIGMQGPFSVEMNACMLRQIHASWLVTKDSGREGGCREKWEAARRSGAGLVVIGRPAENVEKSGAKRVDLAGAVKKISGRFGIWPERRIYLVGMGPGEKKLLTGEAVQALRECEVVLGAERVLELCRQVTDAPCVCEYRKEKIAAYLEEHREYRRVALVFSGDIGFYSGAAGMREAFQGCSLIPVPGIASPVYFLDRLGIPWDGVYLTSCHGRQTDLLPLIRSHKRVCTLLGEPYRVAETARRLTQEGLGEVRITVGERLSYPEEKIISHQAKDMCGVSCDSLSLALFENEKACPAGENQEKAQEKAQGKVPESFPERMLPGLPDEAFVRGNVPMTKEEIRVLSLSRLQLTPESILYDIGAGTGSVSVEAAGWCSRGRVYAIERSPEGAGLIRENAERFGRKNIFVQEGEAPGCLEELESPTHVFIGGSGGKLKEIIRAVRRKNPHARFVMNAVTLETIAEIVTLFGEFPEYGEPEVTQVNVSKSRVLGGYHLMTAANPVYIISFG